MPTRFYGDDAVVLESEFRLPPLRVTLDSVERHFARDAAPRSPLRNPHREARVSADDRRRATPAAVLIPIVPDEGRLDLLLTRRHAEISFGGHVCFPGGRADPGDASPEHTALREAEEEIALDPSAVRVIGRLGDYVTHSGYRIVPVVAAAQPPLDLSPRVGEVEEILRIPLSAALDARSYRLYQSPAAAPRAHFVLEHDGVIVTGPTVAILMGLYEELWESHGGRAGYQSSSA